MSDKNRNVKPIVRVIGIGLISCLLFTVLEIGSYITLRYGIMPADSTLVYAPPHVDKDKYQEYQVYRHPVLGWATPVKEEQTYSVEKESRPNLFFPNPDDASCASVYGDSFTFGDEMEDPDAWANVLSGLLDCKVANFGIGGYGVDQAYLRYELNKTDDAPINVLGIYPDNVLRNLNQYRPFLAGPHSSPTGLKPRFIIEDDQLKLILPPDYNHDELMQVLADPQGSIEHETFLPGSKHGPVLLKFPYSFAVFQVVTSPQVRNFLAKKPSYTHFYDLDDPSDAMLIAEKISQSFVKLAAQRNHRSLLMLYPTVASFRYYKRTNTIATQGLIDVLKRSDIPHFDLHDYFSEYLGERSYCELVTLSCTGHYNVEGNRVVAAALAMQLKQLL